MSITKTNCPSLSDLSNSIGPTDGADSKKSLKPLCDNIFDVQRSELVEVLERLRTAFWSDNVILPTSTPQLQIPPLPSPLVQTPSPQTHQAVKRSVPESDEEQSIEVTKVLAKKRPRLSTPQVEDNSIKKSPLTPITPPSPKSLQAFSSLWPLKKSICRQIKTANRYNETQLLSILTDIYQTKSNEQSRHLANYLIPIAKAMRRENIVKVLEQWCL